MRWPAAPGLPSTFVLDSKGQIAAYFLGPVTTTSLRGVLDRLAAET